MGRFFIGSEYHDDMHGNDGQLLPGHRHKSKEELERISKSLYDAEQSSIEHEQVTTLRFCDIEPPPFVKILRYEYEDLKRRSKRLEILERAFLECRKSEFEEFNDYPNCSFVPDEKSQEVLND
ncbi:hypothetical protein [Streptococcus suis]|uniref:hypothetical protein n=1 Tax=Streptococcus suis TaxID=1307 RepID=UPI000CF44360|nr:hypothetical protein [Streptococcus suis]